MMTTQMNTETRRLRQLLRDRDRRSVADLRHRAAQVASTSRPIVLPRAPQLVYSVAG